jgi:hypothetical protein
MLKKPLPRKPPFSMMDPSEPLLPQILGHDSRMDRGDVTAASPHDRSCLLSSVAHVDCYTTDCILEKMSFRRVVMLRFRLGELAAIRMDNRYVGAKAELEIRRAFRGPRGKMSWPVLDERRRRRIGRQSMPDIDIIPRGWPDRLQIAVGDFDAADRHGMPQHEWENRIVMRFCTPQTRNLDGLVEWRED